MSKELKVTIKGSSRVYNNGNDAVTLRKGGHYPMLSKDAKYWISNGWAVEGYIDLYPDKKGTPPKVYTRRGKG